MTKPINNLTAEYVKSILDYDPEIGELRWKIDRPPRGKRGAIAGWIGVNGYRYIRIKGKDYLAHRLAWVIETGEWPKDRIDHKDLDPLNIKLSNLRQATHADNIRNSPRKKKSVLPKGVSWRPELKKYLAKICKDRKQIYLGVFETKEEAHKAYCDAARELHGEFANFG